jgi:hypothetical protein
MKKGLQIIDIISLQSDTCKIYAQALKKAADRLIKKVGQKAYPNNLVFHSLTNMTPITDRVVRAVQAFKNKDFKNAGVTGGDLMKFIFFWDM